MLDFFIGENMVVRQSSINGSRNVGDFEYDKFREDSATRASVSSCNPDGTNITNIVESNQTNGTQQTKITNGTTVVDTFVADSGNNGIVTGGATLSVPFSTTTAQAVAVTDCSFYSSVSVSINTQGTNSTVNFQYSDDGTTWSPLLLMRYNTNDSQPSSSTTAAAIFNGGLPGKYFRLNITGISANTTSGAISFKSASVPTYFQAVTVPAVSNNIAKSEDSASANSDVGVPAYSIRRDTPVLGANVSSDGDYLPTITDNYGRLWTRSLACDSTGTPYTLFDGSVPVIAQDQSTDPADFYFTLPLGTTTLTSDAVVDATSIVVASNTGASVGKAITIYGTNSRVMQATILSVSGTTIGLNVPIDKAYPSGSTVVFGEWNMNVDGSVTKQIFSIYPPSGAKWDITRIIFSILDDSPMDDAKFGGINSLTNGLVLRKTNGIKKNIFVVNDNSGFAERCYDVRYADKAPAGLYGFTAQKKFGGQDNYGVVVRLDGTPNDKLEIIIQDNLTTLTKLAVTVHGHITQEF